ncbi:MAG: tRNA epoxyqueuosine(34) reductase QueG [Patescibacteria group bacterium]|jgi:epoxyqueuosine reductase
MIETQILKIAQQELGFSLVGIIPAEPAKTFPEYVQWLEHGYAGDMAWMYRDGRKAKRSNVRNVMPEAKTVIVLGYSYKTHDLPVEILNDPARGIIARYAWGKDYHKILKKKLEALITQIERLIGHSVTAKAYVDTGPILERDLAARAGLGFVGKNTTLINMKFGSYLWLCEVLLDIECEPVFIQARGGCRNCIRCLTACPTQALVKPFTLDARRCISYLTIEHKDIIPEELAKLMGNRIFGCDLCQEACPWNNLPKQNRVTIEQQAPYLTDLAKLSDQDFLQRFAGTPIMRAKRSGLLRNVAVALGNWGSQAARLLLEQLAQDKDDVINRQAKQALAKLS